MLNMVMLIGKLHHDPKLEKTKGGSAFCGFKLATSKKVKKNDDWEEQVNLNRVVAWGKTAENLVKFQKKGSLIYVEGELITREWVDRNGNNNSTTEVNAIKIKFLSSKKETNREENTYGFSGQDENELPFQ